MNLAFLDLVVVNLMAFVLSFKREALRLDSWTFDFSSAFKEGKEVPFDWYSDDLSISFMLLLG